MTISTSETPGLQISSDFSSQIQQSIISGLGFAMGGALFALVIRWMDKSHGKR